MNYWEKLFHTCAIVWGVVFVIAFSGVASAETFTIQGTITDTQPIQDKDTEYTNTKMLDRRCSRIWTIQRKSI